MTSQNVDSYIREAERFRLRSYQIRLAHYEQVKRDLREANVSTSDYDRVTRAVVNALEI